MTDQDEKVRNAEMLQRGHYRSHADVAREFNDCIRQLQVLRDTGRRDSLLYLQVLKHAQDLQFGVLKNNTPIGFYLH